MRCPSCQRQMAYSEATGEWVCTHDGTVTVPPKELDRRRRNLEHVRSARAAIDRAVAAAGDEVEP